MGNMNEWIMADAPDNAGWLNYSNLGGNSGWTGDAATSTSAAGTTATNAAANNGGRLSMPGMTNDTPMMQGAFLLAMVLFAIGWHAHLFSVLE